jgi:putative endonuclease
MYYTYILKSTKDAKIYVGYTDDLKQRFLMHNKGLVKATKNRIPFELVYYEACNAKIDAIKREKELKTGFGRAYLKRRLSNI